MGSKHYENPGPTETEVKADTGALVLEFGTAWCGHCASAEPVIESAIQRYREVRHLKIEDGPGRRLGRHFKVKLWPTLVFLRDGIEMARLVRPNKAEEVHEAIMQIL